MFLVSPMAVYIMDHLNHFTSEGTTITICYYGVGYQIISESASLKFWAPLFKTSVVRKYANIFC